VWQRSIIGVVTLSTAEQHVEESLQLVLREATGCWSGAGESRRGNDLEACDESDKSRHERVGEEIAHEINAMLAGS